LDVVRLLNESEVNKIKTRVVKTLQEALVAIENEVFDGAIVDLKLSASNTNITEGNEIIKKIVNLKRFPIFVYSAHLGDLDNTITQSIFFQKFEKTGTSFNDILVKLRDICNTGITNILGKNGIIESHLNKIFWNHIARSFEDLTKSGINEKQLLRYITGHLYEYLEINVANGAFEKYLPEEVYIRPSIKTKFFTGSIIKDKSTGKNFVILTPSCDIANDKAKHALLASICDLTDEPIKGLKIKATSPIAANLNRRQKKQAKEDRDSAKDKLEKLLRNNGGQKYYFLPKSKSFDGGLINFQDLESVGHPGTMSDRFDIVATINSQFLKDIIARFSFYYSRQGAPEVDFEIDNLP
jgi:hypothetical protein